ncbi:MAG: hypothetical protein ABI837_01455 [Acidobacteriota bacterium]
MFFALALFGVLVAGASVVAVLSVVAVALRFALKVIFFPLLLVGLLIKLLFVFVAGIVVAALLLPFVAIALFVLGLAVTPFAIAAMATRSRQQALNGPEYPGGGYRG